MTTDFVHLRVHTEYSLLAGAMRLKSLDKLCQQHNMPAVALTDRNNLFAGLEASVTWADKGVQPIMGCDLDVLYDGHSIAPMVFLAQNETGYDNIIKLNSALYMREGMQEAHVTLDEIAAHCEGVICLTGGPKGPIGSLIAQDKRGHAQDVMQQLAQMFGDRLYVELQRHIVDGARSAMDVAIERAHVEMAYAMELPLVASNDVYFPDATHFNAHDALMCIAGGHYVDQPDPRPQLTPEHYFKTPAQMALLFADLPEAIENTVEIARRCAFGAYRRDPILPKFADDEVEELRKQAKAGLQARLDIIPHAAPIEEYWARLDFELTIIENMGFPGYFLIVADFIKWAKDHDIPVGPGRGSGAGSLVAYALTITDLDPLRYQLLFERFLNPERVSMPDFDIDFCMDRREEVIRYVQEKYGRDRVGQIITFGALLSKAAVRDVGRVLQLSYTKCDQISKLIPVEGVKPVSIKQARKDEPRLAEMEQNEEVVKTLLDYSEQLEGLLRNASTHAAGVVIGDRPLDELVPIYRDPKSDMPVTQFNMKWVEQAGLVKFDFLGLKTLTVIQNAVDLIKTSGRHLHQAADGRALFEPPEGKIDDIGTIPLDDAATYELYAAAKTVAVFQVESTGMMDALKRMSPTCVEDIVALVALYRPGPMENIPTYCDVKNGRAERGSVHPLIDHILEETQGIIVYQEQVMQIAQVMANYSLGGADLLRRAMGKKIKEAMDAERPKFVTGAKDNDVDEKKAEEVFALLEKFANYGFNKSHAAAYAIVSYQTAWLKANHPAEFMAGVMNCDKHLTDKLAIYFQEVRKGLKLPWGAPCVNRSNSDFTVQNGVLVYGLGGLKNVGSEAMKRIEEARGDAPFVSLFDFARRVDLRMIGKKSLEGMARAGAFDVLNGNRRQVLQSLEKLIQYSISVHEQSASDQGSLFGDTGDDLPEPRLPPVPDWTKDERLGEEQKAIGFYLSGHPLDDYKLAFKRKEIELLSELEARATAAGVLGYVPGIITGIQERKSAKGNKFAFVQFSDPSGAYETTVFSDTLEKARPYLQTGNKVVVLAEAKKEADQLKLLARAIEPMEKYVDSATGAGLKIHIDTPDAVPSIAQVLCRADVTQSKGPKGPIYLCISGRDDLPGEIEVDLGLDAPVVPALVAALESLPSVHMVQHIE